MIEQLRLDETDSARYSQGLLHAILNGTSDGIYAKDLQGRYVLVNDAGARLVGTTVEQMRGRHYADVLSSREAEEVAQEDRAALTSGQSQVVETTRILDGEPHWYQTVKTTYRGGDGQMLGIVSISRDVTEQKRAEAALRQSETEYRAMFELAGVGNAQVDYRSGRILRANRHCCEMLGYSEAELTSLTFVDVTYPDDRETNLGLFERRQRGELDAYSLEKRFLCKDGRVLWGELHTALIRDEADQPLYVIATVQDITMRKEAEAERRLLFSAEQQARAAAEAAHQRAAFLAAVSTTLASSLDYQATLRSVANLATANFAAWCIVDLLTDDRIETAAYAAGDVTVQRLLDDLTRDYPIDPHGAHPITQVIESGKAIFATLAPPHFAEAHALDERHRALLQRLPSRSLMIVPMLVRGRPLGAITFGSEQLGRYSAADLVLAEQIAYRAAIAIDNARLYQQSEKAVRLRDQFLAIASHELKSPLTSLSGYAELLQKRADDGVYDERDRRAIHTIVQQTSRLQRMIEAMFDVSRIETGQIAIQREPVDLNRLAAEVCAQMRLLLKRHTLECTESEGPLESEGDVVRLRQMLENLIHNAIKYSPKGGPIRVTVERQGAQAVIGVSDQGIGIPPAAQAKLFSRFYRAPNAETLHISGLGIGLYIVKEIVRLHEGTIAVRSEPGEGTTFTVRLPLREKEPERIC